MEVYLVLASRTDESAGRLMDQFPAGVARLVTPLDLSRPGWRLYSAVPARSVFVANGRPYAVSAVEGVLCLLPCVLPAELLQIVEEARDYAALEMTAFLEYWLSSLTCPVLNSPTAGCLAGPNWRREQWVRAALAAGLPVRPYVRATGRDEDSIGAGGEGEVVTIVGQEVLNGADCRLLERVRALASYAGVDLLAVTFVRDERQELVFDSANTFPRLEGRRAVELIMRYFAAHGAQA